MAAYSYMALVPLIQPPIMKALTTDKERKIRMVQLRTVSKREKILFPAVLLATGGAPAAGRRAAAGDVLLRQPDARRAVWWSG
ncbi:oxaloacetate decarboxylase subunit beta [Klebsiella pneumoniae]|uniref:oxaloacetate decarboxylase (Na(+) extruding) n=1 Tax=Klebsiella pneumoniae TaxID=573 RepID=A0A377TL36_KLEPN|nr:oxaloacetate decarboxylase subunit beta [Klebsiella pneumoniae]